MPQPKRTTAKGRGSQSRVPNRFGALHAESDLEQVQFDDEYLDELSHPRTEFIADDSRNVISENDSPDVPFRYSLNPYRGCEHGCAYCYARPTHEYFGLSAGLDFETKIFVKERAPELLRDWLNRSDWQPEMIAFSGVTDCYQPAERRYQLTRRCLEVALEARQPIGIVTKNALVLRDLDILAAMAESGIVHVRLSVTTLDASLANTLEPRTSTPEARLGAIGELSAAGVPASVMVAPVIPGLNDSEIPKLLEAAAEAGAKSAGYILLRLPLTVRPVFLEWLEQHEPTRMSRVESYVRSTRDGRLNETGFGRRMRGSGPIADQIKKTFEVFSRRYGLDEKPKPLDTSQFRPPRDSSGQRRLF